VEGYKSDASSTNLFTDLGQIALIDSMISIKSKLLIPVEYNSSYTMHIVDEHKKLSSTMEKSVFLDRKSAHFNEHDPTTFVYSKVASKMDDITL